MFSSASMAEMKDKEPVMDQRLRINVNVVWCCCSLCMFNKVDFCHCLQNYLIALATAILCPNPASCRSCINLSIFVSTYGAVNGRRRSFRKGKLFPWKNVCGVNNQHRVNRVVYMRWENQHNEVVSGLWWMWRKKKAFKW